MIRAMTKSISTASWLRIPATRSQIDAILEPGGYKLTTATRTMTAARPRLSPELLAGLDIFQRQLQDDLDMEDDPRFGPMLGALRKGHLLHGHLLVKALWRPSALPGGRPYPLYASEVSLLTDLLGHNVPAKTIERLALDGLISPPVLIGDSTLPRAAYFARHVVEILYEQVVLGLSPVRAKAYLDVFTGRLDEGTLLYLSGLEDVDPAMVQAVRQAGLRS
jgi:hypothetical protein